MPHGDNSCGSERVINLVITIIIGGFNMSTKIKEIDYTESITSLLKSNNIIILPNNVNDPSADILLYPNTTFSLIKEFKANGLVANLFEINGKQIAYQDNRSIDWIAPTLFVTSSLLSQNPELVNIALNVISNYLIYIFNGIKKDPTTKLTLVHRDDMKMRYTKINYDGPVSGLSEVKDIIRKLDHE